MAKRKPAPAEADADVEGGDIDDEKKERTPPKPSYYATTEYKLWLRKQIGERKKKDPEGWTLLAIAKKLKRIDPNADATDGSIGLLLGPKNKIPHGSNTTLMPALNKLFRAAPPPVCNPEDPIAQLHDALAARWAELTPSERRILETIAKGDPGDET